jgi:hypothetical protein
LLPPHTHFSTCLSNQPHRRGLRRAPQSCSTIPDVSGFLASVCQRPASILPVSIQIASFSSVRIELLSSAKRLPWRIWLYFLIFYICGRKTKHQIRFNAGSWGFPISKSCRRTYCTGGGSGELSLSRRDRS